MAVESLAPGALVYYAVPPEQPDNALSRWWHGFTGKRSPYAQALFVERLKAMSPENQYALIQQLYKQRTDLLTGAAQVDAQAAQAKAMLGQSEATREGNWLAYWSNVNAAAIRAGADVSVAKAGLGGKLLMNRDLQPATAQVAADLQRQMHVAATQERDGNAVGAKNTIDEALRQLDREMGALRAVPGQQDALGQHLTGIQYPFASGELRDKVRAAVGEIAPVPPEIQIPEFSAPGARAPGGMPAFSPRGAGQPPGQAPAAAAAGSAVSGTTAPPTQESPGLYGGAPSTGIPRTAPGDTLRSSAEQIGERIRELEAKVRDPAAVLGDLADPFPGLGGGAPRKRSAVDMAAELAPAAAERKALASPRVPLPWAYDRPAPVVSVATGAPAEPAAEAPAPKPATAAAPAAPKPAAPTVAKVPAAAPVTDPIATWNGPQVMQAYRNAAQAGKAGPDFEAWRRTMLAAYKLYGAGAPLEEWAAANLPGYAPRE